MRLKIDSFVVESNVHFPTDYNLLWDASRKALDMVSKLLLKKRDFPGWRKILDWHRELKNSLRSLGRASGPGGKEKEKRVKSATLKYLAKAKALLHKLELFSTAFQSKNTRGAVTMLELSRFMQLMKKQIDLVDRRILKGEKYRMLKKYSPFLKIMPNE